MGESERWVEWLRGGSPWKGPLLTLLLEQPGHSYELAGRLIRRLGPAFKLDHNDADRVLKRAEELGLVSSKWADSKQSRRQVLVYEPTSLTLTVVEHWMGSPVAEEAYRSELWTRMVVSSPEHADALMQALDICERRVFGLLKAHGEPFPTETWTGLELELARLGVTMRLEADLQWIELARGHIIEFLGGGHGAT
jgi:DNA-binding PadR family transcriptional regulator